MTVDFDARNGTRLVELDFIRGLALLVIFWNHLHWFTELGVPLRYGFSDAAGVFVFLSGYISGSVYWKVYQSKGFYGLLAKAWRRAAQIYAAHLTAVVALVCIAAVIPGTSLPNPIHTFLKTFLEDPFTISVAIISLQYFPSLFDILPLYIVMMLAVPWVLSALRRGWKMTLGISFALYCGAQLLPALNIQSYFPSWYLNPLSWSFLFITAMTIGIKSRDGSFRVPAGRPYVVAAACFLVYAFLDLKTVTAVMQSVGVVTDTTMFLFSSPFPFIGKSLLQPVYLIHFFCLTYVATTLPLSLRRLSLSRCASPVALCGRHSLVLFSGGIVLTYVLVYLTTLLGGREYLFYVFAGLGWAATIALARILSRRENVAPRLPGRVEHHVGVPIQHHREARFARE